MTCLPSLLIPLLLSSGVLAETRSEFHERLRQSFQGEFDLTSEATAMWLAVSDPLYGDHYWVFGNSSSSNNDNTPDIAATLEDHFGIGSISKTFGATVTLLLHEQGLLSIDETVAKLVPDFAEEFPQYANNTVRELIAMRTRVPDFLNDRDGLMANLTADPTKRLSIPEIVAFAMQDYPSPIDENCTECGQYSTTNFLVNELIVENVTGISMPQLVRDLVTSPLNLTGTAEPERDAVPPIMPAPAATSYAGQGCVDEFTDTGGTLSIGDDLTYMAQSIVVTGTGGSMHSTIGDLLQWAKSGTGDSLLSEATIAERHDYQLTVEGNDYGLGQFTFDESMELIGPLLTGWYGHSGDAFGSTAYAFRNDALGGAAFAGGTNSCNNPGLVFMLVFYANELNTRVSSTKEPIMSMTEAPSMDVTEAPEETPVDPTETPESESEDPAEETADSGSSVPSLVSLPMILVFVLVMAA